MKTIKFDLDKNFGKFKMPFVANAEDVANELLGFIKEKIN